MKDRIVKFSDLPLQLKFIFEDVDYDPSLLLQRGATKELVVDMLTQSKEILGDLSAVVDFSDIQNKLTNLIQKMVGTLVNFYGFPGSICGAAQTPPIVECLPALGKENSSQNRPGFS